MSMECDVVIISYTADKIIYNMVNHSIHSLRKSEKDIQFNIIIVESNQHASYDGCKMVYTGTTDVHYNAFCNMGIEQCKNNIIALANNDIIYRKGWMSSHVKAFERTDLELLCTKNLKDKAHLKLYKKGLYHHLAPLNNEEKHSIHLTGYLLVMKQSLLDKIGGKLETPVRFWRSESVLNVQLKKAKLSYALNADSHIVHLGAQSYRLLSREEKEFLINHPDPPFDRWRRGIDKRNDLPML